MHHPIRAAHAPSVQRRLRAQRPTLPRSNQEHAHDNPWRSWMQRDTRTLAHHNHKFPDIAFLTCNHERPSATIKNPALPYPVGNAHPSVSTRDIESMTHALTIPLLCWYALNTRPAYSALAYAHNAAVSTLWPDGSRKRWNAHSPRNIPRTHLPQLPAQSHYETSTQTHVHTPW